MDVGNNTCSFGRYFECTRQSVLMSGCLGSIGSGFPAAQVAWAACPERPIWCVSGDDALARAAAFEGPALVEILTDPEPI